MHFFKNTQNRSSEAHKIDYKSRKYRPRASQASLRAQKRDRCLLGKRTWMPIGLDLGSSQASRVILNAPWCTKLRLQSFAFHVFSIVICHVPFCIGFCMILVWFPGSQNLENRVLVEAKREFSQKLCFGGEHCFSSKSDPPKSPFQASETCKITEKCPSKHDCADWLGNRPCIGLVNLHPKWH